MDDIWIISWFNHTAFDANPIWKSPIIKHRKHRTEISKAHSAQSHYSPFVGLC